MISALLLAAGSSRRMGRPKLLLDLQGKPLVRRAAELALGSKADEVLVVVGPHRSDMERALRGLEVRMIDNAEHVSGMASSLRAGLRALSDRVGAVVVLLGDQPFQSSALIDRLIDEYRTSGKPIVVPLYAGIRGNPVLFSRAVFPELLQQEGDQGGRDVIVADPDRVASVPFDSDTPQQDLDTWEDYLSARALLEER